MKRRPWEMRTARAAMVVWMLVAGGCLQIERKSTLAGPGQLGDLRSLLGTWSSASATPSPESCTDFRWEVTEQSGNTAAGTFRATCPGGLVVAGTARGTLLGTTISWTATGAATVAGLPPCGISLEGHAYLETDRIRIPYTGTTCLGPVAGEEVLKRG
jgi:hypothetical protein